MSRRGQRAEPSAPADTIERARARARTRQAARLDAPAEVARGERREVERAGRARRLVWPVLVSVVFVGLLFVAVFPTQTYLQQRDQLDARRAQLADLETRNAELEDRVQALQDDDAVELLAREEWGLVLPGEEPYAIVGLDGAEGSQGVWPFDDLEDRLETTAEDANTPAVP